jgi:uncharacterized coiled-coil protein SlyX
MDDELKQAFSSLENRLVELETRLSERISERIQDSETKLLSAFYGWARPIEMRVKQLPAIDERLDLLEERISAVERKILERRL